MSQLDRGNVMDINKCLADVEKLAQKGFFHAAMELIYEFDSMNQGQDLYISGELCDELGRLKAKIADNHQAIDMLQKAISFAQTKDAYVKYNAYLGIVYWRLSEMDTAYRCFSHVQNFIPEVGNETKVIFNLNFAIIDGVNGFYDKVIERLEGNLDNFLRLGNKSYIIAVHNNLGLACLESGKLLQAERYLMKTAELSGSTYIETTVELGNLYMLKGDWAQSIVYAKQAMKMVFATNIRYEKDDVARLCNLLAKITLQFGEKGLALQLYEKAQIFFGQLGLWRKWQDLDSEIEKWKLNEQKSSEWKLNESSGNVRWLSESGEVLIAGFSAQVLSDIREFLTYLDAINAQELIDKRISKLLDMRVHYIKLFARYLNLQEKNSEELILASRFADYGLTALESEVVLNPMRSNEAFEQYKQHPALSVEMLKALNLPEPIFDIINDHHECYDGTGFPNGKKREEINEYAQIFSIVDYYATGVTLNEKLHRQVLREMKNLSGRAFTPCLVEAFEIMFLV
jgi:hypothetical protein